MSRIYPHVFTKSPNYFYSLLIDATLCCLYQAQFYRFMSVDAFHKQYHAMVEMNVRILCAKLFSRMMEEHGDAEQKKVSELYEAACADMHIRQLSDIRQKYCRAIDDGVTEDLYPLQRQFAGVASTVQTSVEAAFGK